MGDTKNPITTEKAFMGENTNEIKIFEGHEVEILEIDGKVLFNPYDVGKCLEIGESAVKMAISKMNERQVVKLTNSKVKDVDFRKLHNTGENFLTENGVYKLVFKSHKPNAEKFTDWIADEVLPEIRKTGSYRSKSREDFDMCLYGAKFIADDMKIAESSRLFMYNNLLAKFGLPTDFLPQYTDNGSREQCSATELLKRNGCEIKTATFNQFMIAAGYMELRERPTSKGGTKEYKALTDKGLKYGVNLVSNKNQKECQPYYYADTFMELYNIVTV